MAGFILLCMLLICAAEIPTEGTPFWLMQPECTPPCSESVALSWSVNHLGVSQGGGSAPPPPPPHDTYLSPDEGINYGVPPLSPEIPSQDQLAEPPNLSDCRPVGRENTYDGTTSDAHLDGYYKIVSFDVDETPPPQENLQEQSASEQTSAKTCPQNYDVPRSPYSSDGLCGTRDCNGYSSLESTGDFNQNLNRRTRSCYRDSDCQFYYVDSAGLLNGEIVGYCTRVSDTLSTCDCTPPYFGNNCELKGCPRAMSGQKRSHHIMPGEPTSPGNTHEDHAGDSGGGDAENQISAPYAGAVLDVGRRTLIANRGGDAEHGFECGGERGSCNYARGLCVCKDGFYGRACEYRTSANRCSTNGAVDIECRASAAARHHHFSEDSPDAEANGLGGHYTPQAPCQYGALNEPHCRPA